MMKYATVCSGIGAPEQAWSDLWGHPEFTSEIEAFPSAVLRHHYPDVPNHGDMTNFKEWPDHEQLGLICGGTPCQSFSVAGLRKGMDDPRGNLTLTYLGILARYNPRWFIWENVPGVFSSASGGESDFGRFLSALAELGYSCAYRVLDAQFFGVPQRRRRVFVVGHFGNDWRPPYAVLSEPQSMCRDIKKGGKAGESVTGYAEKGVGGQGFRMLAFGEYADDDTASALKQRDYKDATDLIMVNARQDPIVTEKAQPLDQKGNSQAVCFAENSRSEVRLEGGDGERTGALNTGGGKPGQGLPAVVHWQQGGGEVGDGISGALRSGAEHNYQFLRDDTIVRRLTPRECERLQGFPDDYTRIPWKGKAPEDCPDGPRYKALGNSMAVPVVRWIGRRIQLWDDLKKSGHIK